MLIVVSYAIVFLFSWHEQELITGWMERLRKEKANKNEDVRGNEEYYHASAKGKMVRSAMYRVAQ